MQKAKASKPRASRPAKVASSQVFSKLKDAAAGRKESIQKTVDQTTASDQDVKKQVKKHVEEASQLRKTSKESVLQRDKAIMEAKDALISELKQEVDGLQRQRTVMLQNLTVAKHQTKSQSGYGGVFPLNEELQIEQVERKAVQEKLIEARASLNTVRAELDDKTIELQRERRLREALDVQLAHVKRVNQSLQEVIARVGVTLEDVLRPDGTLDPNQLVFSLVNLALPHVDCHGDALLAWQKLHAVASQSSRPPLLPSHSLDFGASSRAVSPARLDSPSNVSRSRSLGTPASPPPAPAIWPSEDGLRSCPLGITLGWPPALPLPLDAETTS